MRQATLILCILVLASAAFAIHCPSHYQIDTDGGKAWLGLNASGFVAGEGQTFVVECDSRLLSVSFKLILDGITWNNAFPLGTGDILVATLRLPGSAISLASANAIIGFDVGSEWIDFDFSDQDLNLVAGDYLLTCHPLGTNQARLGYWQGEDIYAEGVRYVSEGGGAGPWIEIGSEFGDLAIQVDMEVPIASEAISWSEIKVLFQ